MIVTYHNLGQLLLGLVHTCHIIKGDASYSLRLLLMPSSSFVLGQLQGQLVQRTQQQPNVQDVDLHASAVCQVHLTGDCCLVALHISAAFSLPMQLKLCVHRTDL